MPGRKLNPIEHIAVLDQVGKKHVVVKYAGPAEAAVREDDRAEVEFRLVNGQRVDPVDDQRFRSTDGRLELHKFV